MKICFDVMLELWSWMEMARNMEELYMIKAARWAVQADFDRKTRLEMKLDKVCDWGIEAAGWIR